MLAFEDCIRFSGLTPDQLDAIADVKHLPPIVAAEWAEATLARPGGPELVELALALAVVEARARGHQRRADRFLDGLESYRRARAGDPAPVAL